TRALARSCFTPEAESCAYISTLVSTKYLSLMELVSRIRRRPAQVQTTAKPCERASARLLERFSFANHRLQAFSNQRTYRLPLFGRNNPRFLQQFSIELESYIRLHGNLSHSNTCSTILRARVDIGQSASVWERSFIRTRPNKSGNPRNSKRSMRLRRAGSSWLERRRRLRSSGDPSGSRTRVPDVRGRCPNH